LLDYQRLARAKHSRGHRPIQLSPLRLDVYCSPVENPFMIISALSPALLVLALASGPAATQAGKPPDKPEAPKKDEPKEKARRKRVVSDLSGFDLLDQGKVKKESMVVGATRGFAPPVLLAPRLGRVYGDRPVFEWSDDNKPAGFVVAVTDESQEEIFRAETATSQWAYPKDAPRLEPGRTYFWTVQASSGLFTSPSDPAGLLVMAGSQREEIDRALAAISAADPYEQGRARAKVFTDHRLWYDALSAYSDVIARFPDRPEAYEERATIYAQLDATQARADADFARAEGLKARAR